METNKFREAGAGKTTAREKIELAYMDLLQEKKMQEISVVDVLEKSGISKSTFYRNYQDVFDIYDGLLTSLVENSVEVIKQIFAENDVTYEYVEKTISEGIFIPAAFYFDYNDSFVVKNAIESGNIQVLRLLYYKLYTCLVSLVEELELCREYREFLCKFFMRGFLDCFISDFFCGKDFDCELLHIAFDFVKILKNGEVFRDE